MSWDSAVIFAGGKSSRMGQDKALLPFGGYDTLAEYQYKRLGKWFDNVFISSKEDKFSFVPLTIKDLYDESSPMVALASSLDQIDADEIFIISVDMPHVDEELISRMFDKYMQDRALEIVISTSPYGLEPLCGIYSTKISDRAKALASEGKHRMKDLLDICNTYTIKCDRENIFTNLNTPDDYRIYHKDTDAKH